MYIYYHRKKVPILIDKAKADFRTPFLHHEKGSQRFQSRSRTCGCTQTPEKRQALNFGVWNPRIDPPKIRRLEIKSWNFETIHFAAYNFGDAQVALKKMTVSFIYPSICEENLLFNFHRGDFLPNVSRAFKIEPDIYLQHFLVRRDAAMPQEDGVLTKLWPRGFKFSKDRLWSVGRCHYSHDFAKRCQVIQSPLLWKPQASTSCM